jgi:hypothetical protein
MTKNQDQALRAHILELAAKHGDRRRFKKLLPHLHDTDLLATALITQFSDHWSGEESGAYLTSLGFSEAELRLAVHLADLAYPNHPLS